MTANSSMTADPLPEDTLDHDGLDSLLGFHIRRAQVVMHRHISEGLAEFDLSQKQAAVFWLIGANPGTSQIRIAAALLMDRATTMSIVDKLEARGFIMRRRSKQDRRRQELYITDRGRAELRKVKARTHEIEAKFLDLVPEGRRRELLRSLKTIYESGV